jgi:hypothetical protein
MYNSERKKMMSRFTQDNIFSSGLTLNIYKVLILFAKPFIESTNVIRVKSQKVDPYVITKKDNLFKNINTFIESSEDDMELED